MPSIYQRRGLRWLVGLGVPVALLCLLFFALSFQTTPPCIFYEITGLLCPGCGAGRATLALLEGRIYAAFRFQPLYVLALPLLVYYLIKVYLAFVVGRDVLPFPEVRNRWVGITVLIVILSYWILRNIPIVPFCYLAPTAI